jgi:hypothetical protein
MARLLVTAESHGHWRTASSGFVCLVAMLLSGAVVAAELKGVKEVTFDDVKLDMKKGDPYEASLLSDKVKQLDGKSIRIRGYILPGFQQTGITQFVLVRDNMECCFGPGAMLHDCILVEMVAPASTSFTVRPVSVEGKFSIREVKDPVNGNYLAIYHLDGKEVK